MYPTQLTIAAGNIYLSVVAAVDHDQQLHGHSDICAPYLLCGQ